jgi:hypothetical protein
MPDCIGAAQSSKEISPSALLWYFGGWELCSRFCSVRPAQICNQTLAVAFGNQALHFSPQLTIASKGMFFPGGLSNSRLCAPIPSRLSYSNHSWRGSNWILSALFLLCELCASALSALMLIFFGFS